MIFNQHIKYISVAGISLLVSASALAQIVSYDMTGNSGVTSEQSFSSKDANVTTSTVTRTGLTAESGSNLFSSSAWNTTGTLSLTNDFIGFTITPNTGFSATLTQISFKVSGSSSAPVSLVVAFSTNGFSSSTQSSAFTITTSLVNNIFDFSDFTLPPGTSIAFRFFAFGTASVGGGTSASGGSVRFDDIILSGTTTISSVPEPSTYALLGGVASLALVCARRVHSRRLHAVGKALVSG